MRVIIDTNCLISCIGKKSAYRNVFDAFLQNNISICASTEILLEYEEIFLRHWGTKVTYNILGLFEVSENFEQIQVYYNFHLVEKDEDDNKFVDAYLASGAEYLISNDSSIISLKKNIFPPLVILTLEEFSKII